MPDDAKLGLLAGVIGVVVVATLYYQKPPDPALTPRTDPPAVTVAITPTLPHPAAVPPRQPLELERPIAPRSEAPAAPASYPRR